MASIKSMDRISAKWIERASVASEDYKLGVMSPRRPWEESTKAAEGNYEDGIQAAISRKAFGKGVGAAGNAKWQRKAADVGAGRFGPGIRAAKPEYEKGFSPYRAVIEGTALPPKGVKGSPENYERVRAIGTALHNKKIS